MAEGIRSSVEHRCSLDELWEVLGTQEFDKTQGLASEFVQSRLKQEGPNISGVAKEGELQCTVIRDGGVRTKVDSYQIVRGDFLFIENGDLITADVRILESDSMQVDYGSITAEGNPLSRSPDRINEENIFESANFCICNSRCVSGSGIGVVTNTGQKTIWAKLKARF